ncbi:hypothetical protein [Listeria sp. ILCC792]|uniref:hypothetical protein n=1 Tax=Listeria sp. ILCC792 TaxID=1918331 RepID=UPI000B59831F|nr:hypothetical protein [Listeria sp. ILCC792]
MDLPENEFVNIEYLQYTQDKFYDIFNEEAILKSREFSNDSAGMGFYRLVYFYKSYKIIFEYEKFYFTLKIENNGNFAHFFANHNELKNTLTKTNINVAIYTLKQDLEKGSLTFYTINKNGKLKKIEGGRKYEL